VAEAIARYMPEEAERRRREAAENRHFTVHTDHVAGTEGTCEVAAVLDLETAVREEAAVLQELGNTEPLDVRRSQAIGVIARRDLTLDRHHDDDTGADSEPAAPSPRAKRRGDRRVVLNLHLTDAALTGANTVGRCGNTRTPVLVEQLRQWCGTAGQIILRPVRYLVDHTGTRPVTNPETGEPWPPRPTPPTRGVTGMPEGADGTSGRRPLRRQSTQEQGRCP
jgi:hypothetical protein